MIVLENILTAEELATVREFLREAQFVDGKMTADASIRNRKENEQIKRSETALPVDRLIAQAFIRHALFQAWALPMRMVPPLFNRYGEGMFYGDHVDNVICADPPLRADISLTLFLSDPADYDGGHLQFHGGADMPAARTLGSGVFFPSFLAHQVTPVMRGLRRSLVAWAYGPQFR